MTTTQPLFSIKDLTLSMGDQLLYRDFSATLPTGGLTGIIGANGCGKSSLMRCLAGLIAPDRGQILCQGEALSDLSSLQRAQRIAYLSQNPPSLPDMTVEGLVAKGRTPWRRPFLPLGEEDRQIIDEALQATGLLELKERRLAALSGGQRQRVWLSMALAQKTPVILLDEPTSYLDLPHQLSLLHLLQKLAREQGCSIVMILHDLTLSGRFCDHILALADGKVVSSGPPDAALDAACVEAVYGLRAQVEPDPVFSKPVVYPID